MACLEEESYEKSLNYDSSEQSSEACSGHLLLSDSGSLDPRFEKKRKADRAYQKRIKDTLRKSKEERRKLEPQTLEEDPALKILFREVNRLQDENKHLQHIVDKLQNVPRDYIAKFEVEFSNDEAKEKAIKMVGDLPGITNVNQDLKSKALVVKGAMDLLLVQKTLSNFGDANLVFYDVDTTKKDEPEEGKKDQIHPKMEPAETTKKKDKKEHASGSKSPDAPIPKKD